MNSSVLKFLLTITLIMLIIVGCSNGSKAPWRAHCGECFNC